MVGAGAFCQHTCARIYGPSFALVFAKTGSINSGTDHFKCASPPNDPWSSWSHGYVSLIFSSLRLILYCRRVLMVCCPIISQIIQARPPKSSCHLLRLTSLIPGELPSLPKSDSSWFLGRTEYRGWIIWLMTGLPLLVFWGEHCLGVTHLTHVLSLSLLGLLHLIHILDLTHLVFWGDQYLKVWLIWLMAARLSLLGFWREQYLKSLTHLTHVFDLPLLGFRGEQYLKVWLICFMAWVRLFSVSGENNF